jgi:putative pyruvate formate lyase activating enzyme
MIKIHPNPIAEACSIILSIMTAKKPRYLNLLENQALEKRAATAALHLAACDVCPWNCGVDRTAGELGRCKTGQYAQVSSYGPHPGEERPISGTRGSGTIFFTRCNLGCVFCQNAEISQLQFGQEYAAEELAQIMLDLQAMGCHNINLVSPSHVIPQILGALSIAAKNGLSLPLVYNSGGYDSLDMLCLLNGVVDIYMPDMKYGDEAIAKKYSLIKDYPKINQNAVLEMQRQVGDLEMNQNGIALSGLLIRHLVLPHDLANSEKILRFLAKEVSKNVYLNVMAQYRPAHEAKEFPELNRSIQTQEFQRVIKMAERLGFKRLDF